jgi:AcrR family transcriptional regulator
MGRIAGVTAEETRGRVLDGAATAFARSGYDGTSIAEIASESGVSTGAIYAHFSGKAELFAATLLSHGSVEAEQVMHLGQDHTAGRILRDGGLALAHRDPAEGSLLVEAVVAARRDPEVAKVVTATLLEREAHIAQLVATGQEDGRTDPTIRADAVARFTLMLVLGSLMVSALELPPVDDDQWAELINDLISRFDARTTT